MPASIGCAEVSKPLLPFQVPVFSELSVHVSKSCFGGVPARAGWLVEVWPGEGCECAHFGLCQYPRQAPYELSNGGTGWVSTGYRRGWLFRGSCKTQYASEHGWEHFLRCHKTILSLLKFWRQMGVAVEVNDEGGFWKTGSGEKVARRPGKLQRSDCSRGRRIQGCRRRPAARAIPSSHPSSRAATSSGSKPKAGRNSESNFHKCGV